MNDNISTFNTIHTKQISTDSNNTEGRGYLRANSLEKDSSSLEDRPCKYENDSYNYSNKTREPLSPQTSDQCDSISKDRQNEGRTLPFSFDLDKIIERYGEDCDLLRLILSSKVEEDRRKAEEARLKQKELDCRTFGKEQTNQITACQNCKNKINASEEETNNQNYYKGKGRDTFSLSFEQLTSKSTEEEYQTTGDNNSKRKIRDDDQHQLIFTNSKDDEYFPPSSSYLSPEQSEKCSHPSKKHGSFNQKYLSSLSDVSPKSLFASTPNNVPTRQLHALDYLNTRESISPSIYPRNPFTEKFNMGDCVSPNTLPPISSSLLSQDHPQGGPSSPFMSMQHSSTVTSTPVFNNPNIGYKNRFQHLPTLDSFESSIMETLPFDDKSDSESSVDEIYSSSKRDLVKRNHPTDSIFTEHQTGIVSLDNSAKILQKRDKSFTNNHNSGHHFTVDESTKKLPLPPNTIQKNYSSEFSMRPRRRRREMQAISMIIETREFPYNDGYVWKNNGNTIHKRSGQKSIYYKCSNSNAGCPVNKTVTFRDNGEYLIKYRGTHLNECSRLKRVATV